MTESNSVQMYSENALEQLQEIPKRLRDLSTEIERQVGNADQNEVTWSAQQVIGTFFEGIAEIGSLLANVPYHVANFERESAKVGQESKLQQRTSA